MNTEEVAEKTENQEEGAEAQKEEAEANPAESKAVDFEAVYAKGDFKPAAGIVFEDKQAGEKDGEDDELVYINIFPGNIEYYFQKVNDESLNGPCPEMENTAQNGWNHFAISFNKGNLKMFVNGKRVVNLPNLRQPVKFSLVSNEKGYVANIRVTK